MWVDPSDITVLAAVDDVQPAIAAVAEHYRVAVGEIDLERVAELRRKLPCAEHERPVALE